MADEQAPAQSEREPLGFTDRTRSSSSEYAHEQGWGLNEVERTAVPAEKQAFEGGTDYDYGARDFGDTATDTSAVQPSPDSVEYILGTEPEPEEKGA